MLENFNDVVQKENVDESEFTLLAIDSADDIENNFPDLPKHQRFVLKNPMGWGEMVEEYPYLRHNDEPGTQGGVTRNRPVARGLVDDSENFAVLYNRLETEVEELLSDSENANIWILSSLGGGTGSGMQPILAAMLYDVVREIDILGAQDPGVYINGVGTLPKLSGLEGGHYPDVKAEYIANSYVALRELRSLFERDHSEDPIEINVYADDRGTLKEDQIPAIKETPFEKYFILPIEEKELTTKRSRDNMNRIVSDTILYFSTAAGIENYPDIDDADIGYEEETIYTINETTVTVPYDDIVNYVELDEDLFQLETDETKLTQLQDVYERNTEFLSHILRSGRGVVPEKGGFNSLVNSCKKDVETVLNSVAVRKISESDIENEKEKSIKDIRQKTESLNNRFDESREIGDEERQIEDDVPLMATDDVDPVYEIIQYFYYDQLYDHLNNRIETRQFASTVDSVWEIHGTDVVAAMEAEGELDDSIEAVKRGDTDERYDRLTAWLEYRLSELESEEEGILSGLFGGDDTESEINTIKKLIANLKNEKANRDQLISLRDTTETKRTTVRDRLRDLRDEFEVAVDSVSEDITQIGNKKQRIKDQKAALTDPDNNNSLIEFSSEQFSTFSVSNPDRLSKEDIEKIKNREWNLKDVAESPAWDKNDMLFNIEQLLQDQIRERITDKATSPVYGILQILRNDDNSWLDEEVRKITKNSYAPFYGVKSSGVVSDPLELRFLATYAPIDWSETSEFGTIDRALARDDKSAVSMFVDTDEENEDEIRDQYFRPAYPELY